MPNTIGERIREALRRRRWEMTELSEHAAIPYRTLQNWIKREAIPTDGAVTIARTLSVSVVWLVTGEGSMEPAAPAVAPPSPEALEELRDWIGRVLPTSRGAGAKPSVSEMVAELEAQGWRLEPPPDERSRGAP